MITFESIQLFLLFICLLIKILAYSPDWYEMIGGPRLPSNNDNNPPLPRPPPNNNVQPQIPGVYYIDSRPPRQQREPAVFANFIPQTIAEPVPKTNKIIRRFRRMLNRNAERNDEQFNEVEILSEDQIGPLVRLEGEREPEPIQVRAARIGWF